MAAAMAAGSAYTMTIARHLKLGLDAIAYILLGGFLADGDGYSNPALLYAHGIKKPTANFPPGYPLFLAGLHKIGITTPTGDQLAGVVCGGATVLMTGLLARRITGRDGVGLVAAGLVAFSPALMATNGSLMSETLSVPLTVAVLLSADGARRSSSLLRWIAVGFLAGLLALVRSEDLLVGIVLVPVLVIAAPSSRTGGAGRRAARVAVSLIAVVAVLSPWLVRNYETFSPRVVLSTNEGKTWAGANCAAAYSGPLIGYWDYSCLGHVQLADSNEAEYDKVLRSQGTEYLKAHLGRVPVVVGVRVLRAWGMFAPLQQAKLDALQTRSIGWQQLAWPVSLVVLLIAAPGFFRMRKDRFALV
ncbi:MAG: glycosyltransferase family 39 protein, partial [Nitrososphaerales archaeon]